MMKRLVLAALGIAVVATSTTAATRKVLMEEFTNVQCGPCWTHDPWMVQFVADHYPSDLSVVYYHMYWPGYDPFWENNTVDNAARRAYYTVNAVPSNRQDGFEPPSYPYTQAVLEQRHAAAMAVPSELSIGLSGTWYPGSAAGDIRVEIDAEADIPSGALYLHVVLAERNVPWNGYQGYDNHDFLMRYMITSGAGQSIPSFTLGENRVYDFDWDFWSTFADPGDMVGPAPTESNFVLVAWVQDNTTKQVLQSEAIAVMDMSFVSVGDASVMLGARLGQNTPNPFNPTTSIPITLEDEGPAVVRVYGPSGSLVRTLSQGVLPAGVTNLNWDGRDIAGREVGSGVYYVNLEVNGESVSRSMTLLK